VLFSIKLLSIKSNWSFINLPFLLLHISSVSRLKRLSFRILIQVGRSNCSR
jgi:hypothetical protein